MREKPAIANSEILSCLNASYGLLAVKAEFLPIGADGQAWAFRVDTADESYFLKIKRGQPAQSMLIVPDYLKAQGVPEVVAPLRTIDGKLCVEMDDYALILYPFLTGESAWGKTLSEQQMRSWGDIVRRIHQADIIPSIADTVRHETYVPFCNSLFKRMNRIIMTEAYEGDIATALAQEWRTRLSEIQFAYNRCLALGDRIKRQTLTHVICHADIHQANIMLEADGGIRVVDWDEVIIAPKERDLMFFDVSDPNPDEGFFAGYQNTDVNYVAIAYYRYDWVVQEFAEWAAWILDTPDRPIAEQTYALSEFKKLFSTGDVLDEATKAFARIT